MHLSALLSLRHLTVGFGVLLAFLSISTLASHSSGPNITIQPILPFNFYTVIAKAVASPSFVMADDWFQRDGNPFRILSGDIHYFRIP